MTIPPIFLTACTLCLLALNSLLASSRASQSNFASSQLLAIASKEEQIYQRLAEDPEFYSATDLERQLQALIASYKAYLLEQAADVDGWILYGKLLRRVHANDAAFNAFLKADQLDPALAVVKQQIGTHLAESGRGKAALPFYIQATELEPETAIYHFALGQLLDGFKVEFVEQAVFSIDAIDREMLKAFRRAVALEPENINFQMRLGETYYDLDQPDWPAAQRHWDQLNKRIDAPWQRQIIELHRARVLGKLGQIEAAERVLDGIQHPSLQDSRQKVLNQLNSL